MNNPHFDSFDLGYCLGPNPTGKAEWQVPQLIRREKFVANDLTAKISATDAVMVPMLLDACKTQLL